MAKKKTTKKAVKKAATKKAVKKAVKKTVKKTSLKAKTGGLGLTVGAHVPDLTLAATGHKSIRLTELRNKKVVLFFYPKDATPGCTIEGHEFTNLKNEFEKENTTVLGVSRDTVASHEKFKQKEKYTIDLLADTEEKLCSTFGVIKDKNMYGKTVRGIERSTFLVDENGQVVREWRGVKAEGHAQQVLDYIKTTKSTK